MSILAYVGLPGSGKSYNVVAHQIIPALKDGRVVVTNIKLHMELVHEMFPLADVRDFPIEKVLAEPDLVEELAPAGCVLIIDELWRLFPAGLKVNNVPESFKSLLAEHRHRVDVQGRSMQIVYVTQDLAQIGHFARQLVEQTFLHTKLGHLGASGSFRVRVFHGPVTGPNPGKNSELRYFLGRYQPQIYRLYQSHTMSESATAGADESMVDKRGNIWRRPGIWIAAAICVIGAVWAVIALNGVFGKAEASPTVAGGLQKSGIVKLNTQSRIVSQSIDSPAQTMTLNVTGCIQLVFSDARVQCECTTREGIRVKDEAACMTWMRTRIAGAGGSSAKAENISYLNSARSVLSADMQP